ncbi:MAG: GntR family transcriptional regulator [Ardenticatenaceae bacterium]
MALKTDFVPISKPRSLQDLAYGILKEAILTLQLKPGDGVSHRQLAAQLQISETPIRDALRDLEQEGFVKRIPHKGTFITEIDPADIKESFQIRASLEQLAVQLAIPNLTPADIDEMRRFLQLAQCAMIEGKREECSAYGAQFHQRFINRSNNKRLIAILSNLDDHLARFRRVSDLIEGRLDKSQVEHQRVFDAICKQDVEEAGKAIYAHLQSVMQDMQSTKE